MTTNTTPFLFSLNSRFLNEPDISNDEFLDSLDQVGVWLRALAAHDSLERYTSAESSVAQRLAALSNIYLQLGAQFEDQAVTLIAFSVWSKNRELSLPDLFFRIFVGRPTGSAACSEIERVHRKLTTDSSTRVAVDVKSFFREVAEMTDTEMVQFFLAYRWRSVPSVKLIPKRHIKVWTALPGEFRRISESFFDEGQIPRMSAAYNKIKHGPQLVFQNPMDRARRFGDPADLGEPITRYKVLDKLGVRLLLAGASTRPESANNDSRSVAPFLIDDEESVRRIVFGTMVYHATFFRTLVKMQTALSRRSRIDLDGPDEGVRRMVAAAERYAVWGSTRQ